MSAPMWDNAVENYVKEQQISNIDVLARGITDGTLKLVHLVELLGPHLTSTETVTRVHGTRLLAEVLHRLPTDYLNDKEVDLLITFFCDRLKDHHSVSPHVLHGILALSTFKWLSEGRAAKIVGDVFREVHVQSLAQSDRRAAYRLLENFLASRLEELKKLGTDFVYNYIQAMDGEQDPRNLVINFRTVTVITQYFPIGVFAEELFEVTSCYFPIDFSPPPNDPHGIRKEDLILSLRQCMASTPLFAKYCLPLLIEKMTSDIQSAKMEAFDTLTACASCYSADVFSEFQETLLSCIKREVFAASSSTLEKAALSALTALVAVLTKGVSETLNGFLHDLFKECKHYLCEPELKLMSASGRLLQAAAEASRTSCCIVLKTVLPLLLEQFHVHPQSFHRKTILDLLLNLIKISKNFEYDNEVPNPVVEYKDTLTSILMSILSNTNWQLRRSGVVGLVGLLSLKVVLNEKERHLVAEHFINLVLTDVDGSVRTESIAALAYMSKEYPEVIKEKVLPVLINKLKDEPMETNQGQLSTDLVLNTLSVISTHTDILQITVPDILDHIESISKKPCTEESVKESQAALTHLLTLIETTVSDMTNLELYYKNTLTRILSHCIRCSLEDNDHVFWRTEVIHIAASMVRTIAQNLDERRSLDFVLLLMDVFQRGKTGQLQDFSNSKSFQPLHAHSPWQQTQTIVLFSAGVCSCVPKVVSGIAGLDDLLKQLLSVALESTHNLSREAAGKMAAGIVNKMESGPVMDNFLQTTRHQLETSLKDADAEVKQQTAMMWFWMTKALILRGHSIATDFIDKMMSMFEDPSLASTVPNGFYIILNEFGDIMTKPMHATIRMMYRQKFFIDTLPKLTQGFEVTAPGNKQHYLTALSYLLRFIPKQVLLCELPPLVPLLVQSLLVEEISLQLSTMNTMYDLLHDAPEVLGQYLDSLIPQLLKLTSYESSMKVRIAALQCIGMMSTMPRHLTVPYNKQVIRELAAVIDDKKRLVRKEAVQARGEWYLLDSPKK